MKATRQRGTDYLPAELLRCSSDRPLPDTFLWEQTRWPDCLHLPKHSGKVDSLFCFSWALLKLFTFDVWVEKRQESTLTRGCVGDSVHLQDEVVLEENVSDDGEQVDQDESQHGGQHNGAPVARHALDHVQQRLLSVH